MIQLKNILKIMLLIITQTSTPSIHFEKYPTYTDTQKNNIQLIQIILQELRHPQINRQWLSDNIADLKKIIPNTKPQRKRIDYLISCCQGPIIPHETTHP